MGCQAGIHQITIYVAPFAKSPIIEQFEVIIDDEWHDVVCQTLLEHQQPTYSSITVLKRMNLLESHMEIDNVFQRLLPFVIIVAYQSLHLLVNIFWRTRFLSSHLVCQPLVVANSKPVFLAIRRSRLQQQVKLLNETFRQRFFCMVDDLVDYTEVIYGFNDIIYINCCIADANRVCLKNIACLVVGQTAAFYVVGVISQVNLRTMVDTSL